MLIPNNYEFNFHHKISTRVLLSNQYQGKDVRCVEFELLSITIVAISCDVVSDRNWNSKLLTLIEEFGQYVSIGTSPEVCDVCTRRSPVHFVRSS